MSQEGQRRRQEDERNGNSNGIWSIVGIAAGIAAGALAGGAYYMTQRKRETETDVGHQQQNPERRSQLSSRSTGSTSSGSGLSLASVRGYLSSLLGSASLSSFSEQRSVPRSAVPRNPDITNLNGLLSDIHVRYIQLKTEDFALHYNVFMDVFLKLHEAMKQVDPYYNRYSSAIQFAGSHYDRLRIKKPDEFDMDVVIRLPLNSDVNSEDPNQSDFILEPKAPGFVQLKMGVQYQSLPLRDGVEWLVNRPAYEWRDERNYLLRSHFINWFKGVVSRALNMCPGRTYVVDGVGYRLRLTESGPAVTLVLEGAGGFRLDVDLVPSLRFPESRWPVCRGYRAVPRTARRPYWLLVPKPNKAAPSTDQTRSWRIAMQDQERELMKNLYNCKQIIRLLKKLRDGQEMKKIASYYVKTLFLWEIVERDDPAFWRKSPAELFKIMVTRFYNAMVSGNIPYFWNKDNNLLAGIERGILNTYAARLARLLQLLEQPMEYKQVAKYLLSREEFSEYNARFLHI